MFMWKAHEGACKIITNIILMINGTGLMDPYVVFQLLFPLEKCCINLTF